MDKRLPLALRIDGDGEAFFSIIPEGDTKIIHYSLFIIHYSLFILLPFCVILHPRTEKERSL